MHRTVYRKLRNRTSVLPMAAVTLGLALSGFAEETETAEQIAALSERVAQLEAQAANPESAGLWPGFEFHGYLRSGFGVDSNGGPMDAFKAPNAGAKYRLGNEAETYLETLFSQSMFPEAGDADFVTYIRMAYVLPSSDNSSYDATLSLPEAYVEGRGVIAAAPDTTFWAGQRFYDRWDIHMNDYYYHDLSGFGGGVEEVAMPSGKLALAWIGGSISETTSSGLPHPDSDAVLNKNNLDLRWYALPVPMGELAFNATLSIFDGEDYSVDGSSDPVVIEDDTGYAAGIFYTLEEKGVWRNRLVAQYGTGSGAEFKAVITAPRQLSINGGDIVDVSKFENLRIIDDFMIDTDGPWSLFAAAVLEQSDLGQHEGGDKLDWYSMGIRPTYFFSDHYALAFEAGWDYTDLEGGSSGSLYKFTLAPQIVPAATILSRPSLRLFLTYATWSDDFVGAVAANSYAEDNEGLTMGVQVETWW